MTTLFTQPRTQTAAGKADASVNAQQARQGQAARDGWTG